MQSLHCIVRHLIAATTTLQTPRLLASRAFASPVSRPFSTPGGPNNADDDAWTKGTGGGAAAADDLGWDIDSWSTGLTKEHFDGQAVGRQSNPSPSVGERSTGAEFRSLGGGGGAAAGGGDELSEEMKLLEEEGKWAKAFNDGWSDRLKETKVMLKQAKMPGLRGSYLKDSEKAEMYRLHKENPEVYTVEKLAKDYRIMRQRVHAILWLKKDEEEMEKRLGHPLDDAVELLLDSYPDTFRSNDREFHVAALPHKPEFKVMPEDWDGIPRDPDEVHYEISKREDKMLYEEFVQRFNFNLKRLEGHVKVHKYSRRRPTGGWNFTVQKMGPKGKRGCGGGWKFVSMPDGSTRPLNEMEKMHLKREAFLPRRRILP